MAAILHQTSLSPLLPLQDVDSFLSIIAKRVTKTQSGWCAAVTTQFDWLVVNTIAKKLFIKAGNRNMKKVDS